MIKFGHTRKRKDRKGRTRYQKIIEVWKEGRQLYKAKTFDSEKEADTWGKKTYYEMENGIVTKESLKDRKVSDAIDRYIIEILPRMPKNARNVQQHLGWWRNEIGNRKLNEVLPYHVSAGRDRLEKEPTHQNKKRAPATIVRYIASLSSVFEAAIKDWYWIEKNPVKLVRKPSVSNARTRFLTEDECEKLLDACLESRNPYLYSIVALALGTGMRRGELLGLRWQDVDLREKSITLTKTKNGSMRCIPLVPVTLKILMPLFENETVLDPSHHIFPSLNLERYIDIRTAWIFAVKRACIKDFKFHDLRHSCASFLQATGATIQEIMEILGHRDIRSTIRYTHITFRKISESLERAGQKCMGGRV